MLIAPHLPGVVAAAAVLDDLGASGAARALQQGVAVHVREQVRAADDLDQPPLLVGGAGPAPLDHAAAVAGGGAGHVVAPSGHRYVSAAVACASTPLRRPQQRQDQRENDGRRSVLPAWYAARPTASASTAAARNAAPTIVMRVPADGWPSFPTAMCTKKPPDW